MCVCVCVVHVEPLDGAMLCQRVMCGHKSVEHDSHNIPHIWMDARTKPPISTWEQGKTNISAVWHIFKHHWHKKHGYVASACWTKPRNSKWMHHHHMEESKDSYSLFTVMATPKMTWRQNSHWMEFLIPCGSVSRGEVQGVQIPFDLHKLRFIPCTTHEWWLSWIVEGF